VPRAAYWDFGDGYGINDCTGHGTHVAGTLGGTRWGVAKSVTIVPVKVFPCAHTTRTSIIVAAINWVIEDHAAGQPAVVNMSLGGPVSTALDSAVRALISDGITVVVAAMNSSADSCTFSPAHAPEAITVAASTIDDTYASFTNFGPCNDLYAPGVDIESASNESDTGSTLKQGTSMATPHVAGAAALLLQRCPTATPAQVWATIDAATTRDVLTEHPGDPDKLLHVEVAPARTCPSQPTELSAVVPPAGRVRSGEVKLTWSQPASNGGSAINGYVIQRSGNGTNWATLPDLVSPARSVIDRGLYNGYTYMFRVAAKNATGRGAWSTTVRATPRWKPQAPSLEVRSAPARGVRSGQLKLTWMPPYDTGGSPITDYVIQQLNADDTWTTLVDGVSTARAHTLSGLVNGRFYTFRVAARNAVGDSRWSYPAQGLPRWKPSTPRRLRAIVAPLRGVGSGEVRLTWRPPRSSGGGEWTRLTDYVIQRSTNGRTWTKVRDGVSAATSHVVRGLTNGHRYRFRVAVRNVVGLGPWSRTVTATPRSD
jgi:subtilisin family serine protease